MAEAEYMALSSAAQEEVWIRELNSDLKSQLSEPGNSNNLQPNPQFHGRSKNINSTKIYLKYCPSEDMLADILTEGISSDRFQRLRKLCGINFAYRVKR